MADDKAKMGNADRSRVAGGEGRKVDYFARTHRTTTEPAREFIARTGNNRAQFHAATEKLE